jgi:hypothetical protein
MRLQAVTLAALLAATPLAAQDGTVICRSGETINQCQQRLTPIGGAAPAAVADALARLHAKAAGPDLSPQQALSAISDFLPRLATALLAPATGGGKPDLGLKTNLPLNDGILFPWGVTLQFSAVLHDPVVYAPLLDSIPAGIRQSSQTRLEAALNPYENAALTGALNVENSVLGRSMRPHLGVVNNLARAAAGGADGRMMAVAMSRITFSQFLARLAARASANPAGVFDPAVTLPACGARPADLAALVVDCLTAAERDSVEQNISLMAGVASRYLADATDRLRSSGFTHLAQLVNNQPQLSFSWEVDPRASVVGPIEWTAQGRFELGFANMNSLRRFARSRCANALTPDCLRRFVGANPVAGSLARGDRLFAALDVTRQAAWRVDLPDDSVSMSLPSSTTLSLSGGYGAYLGTALDGENRDRVDLQTRYDFARDNSLRQKRWVSSLFYTRHVSGQATALIGLTWANRPQYLGQVERHLNANLGLTYKLNPPPPDPAP